MVHKVEFDRLNVPSDGCLYQKITLEDSVPTYIMLQQSYL